MSLTNSDILITDATIIIGLLVLLTFSSVSSPFVESETSEFFHNWYELKNEIKTINELLIECKDLQKAVNDLKNDDNDGYNSFKDDLRNKFSESNMPQANERGIFRGEGEDPLDIVSDDVKEELIKMCVQLVPIGNEKITKLKVLNEWGSDFKYLEEKDGQFFESLSFKERASGPYWINMINLGMVFPFLISGILDSVLSHRRKDKNDHSATKGGLVFMVLGLGSLIVGLSIIGIGFYNAAAPFLN
ncbi:MAG: hypothetical protein OEQ12_02150 [Nitrosopumilus sp.]|nr:hypothetical protein [Nitrosopumilus sp.]